MPEPHPGLVRPPNDPSIPLKVLSVYPPDPETVARDPERGYPVTLQLSRSTTRFEARAIERLGKGMSYNGARLTISSTTLEAIDAKKDQIKELVAESETEGKRAAQAEAAAEEAADAARAAEVARLEAAAAAITFD